MDKVKVFLGHAKKYHFWVLWGLLLIVGMYTWYAGAASVSENFETYKGTIEKHKTDMERVSSQADHPNQPVIEGIQAQTDRLRKQVYLLWHELYTKQRKAVLTWPEELEQDFQDMIDRRKFGAEIPRNYREQYQNYVRERFMQLADIVQAEKVEVNSSSSGRGERGEGFRRGFGQRGSAAGSNDDDPTNDKQYLVVWSGNQQDLQGQLVWDEAPSSMKIWVTQEDLWVYETLLNIIKNVNVGATGPHNANISEIIAMTVGKDAAAMAFSQGRIQRYTATELGEGPEAAAEPMTRPSAGRPGMMTEEGRGDGEASADDKLLVEQRYLNNEGLPLAADEAPEVGEYKRIPVVLELKMDQRQLPRLLAECANAPLPVEVRQIRINPGSSGGSSAGRDRERPTTSRRTRSGGEGGSRNGEQFNTGQDHADVTIQGIIYLFNQPDNEKLGVTEEQVAQWIPAAESATGLLPGAGEPRDPTPTKPATEPATEPAATEPVAEPADPEGAAAPPVDAGADDDIDADPVGAPAATDGGGAP